MPDRWKASPDSILSAIEYSELIAGIKDARYGKLRRDREALIALMGELTDALAEYDHGGDHHDESCPHCLLIARTDEAVK